jgi:hypothetical protein
MPAGYLKIRDALVAKGMDLADAKGQAAAIWNKHHKDKPVTNKKHHMSSAQLIHEFAIGLPLARTIRPYTPFRSGIPKRSGGGIVGLAKSAAEKTKAATEATGGGITALVDKAEKKVKKWNKWHYAGLGGGLAAAGLGTYAIAGSEEMEAKIELLQEMGLMRHPTHPTTNAALNYGDQLMAKVGGAARKDSAGRPIKRKLQAASELSQEGLWPSGKPLFLFEKQHPFGVILLGLPSEAEELLAKKLGQNQVRTALPGPVAKYPSSPNPNPNAANDPSLQNALNSLLNRNKPLPKRVLPSSNTRGATTANAHDPGSIASILQNDEELMKRRRLAGTWRGTS